MCLYVCAKEEGNKIYAQQSFLTYISPLIGDSQLKRVSTEGIDSSTSRPLQNTDPSHLEKFWVKHILHKNKGAISSVLVRMDASGVLHMSRKNVCPHPYTPELPVV